jgi:hypothetical protein
MIDFKEISPEALSAILFDALERLGAGKRGRRRGPTPGRELGGMGVLWGNRLPPFTSSHPPHLRLLERETAFR